MSRSELRAAASARKYFNPPRVGGNFAYLDLELSVGINIASDATSLVIEPAANNADKG